MKRFFCYKMMLVVAVMVVLCAMPALAGMTSNELKTARETSQELQRAINTTSPRGDIYVVENIDNNAIFIVAYGNMNDAIISEIEYSNGKQHTVNDKFVEVGYLVKLLLEQKGNYTTDVILFYSSAPHGSVVKDIYKEKYYGFSMKRQKDVNIKLY